jgi:hypothetical protein
MKRLTPFVFGLALLTPVLGQETAATHLLRYRFEALAGKTALYTIETDVRQGVDHTGQSDAEGVRWRRDTIEQRYERKGESGRVRQTPRRVEVEIKAPDQEPIRFDSRAGKAIPEGLESIAARVDQTVIVELTARGAVTKVRGAASAAQRASYVAAFLEWPRKAIAVGDRWSKFPLQRTPYPPFGTLVYSTRYTLKNVGKAGRVTVQAETTVLFEPADDVKIDSPVVNISKQSAGGSMVFDANGLLLESRFRSELQITITSGNVVRTERATSETAQRLRSVK